jgi:acetylornithine deacetylase/succinyl-diaminopimelate desuccinylase-like protein
MIPSLQEQLLKHADEYLPSYYEQLARSCMPSTPPTLSERNSALEAILSQFQRHGIEAQFLGRDHPLLYGERYTGAVFTLLLYYSYDMSLFPTWQAEALAACIAALDISQHVTGSFPVNIKWLFESGTTGAISQAELHRLLEEYRELLTIDGCLCYGAGLTELPTQVLALGSKGLLCVELEAQMTSSPFHSSYGAIVPNAAWRLAWALNSLKSPREEVLIEGFYDTLRPVEDDEIESISTLPEQRPQAPQGSTEHLLFGLHGVQLNYALLLTPTCTINAISSGSIVPRQLPHTAYTNTVIPAQAKAQVDFHLVPDQEPGDIFSKLQQHLQTQDFQDVQARLIYGSLPAWTPIHDPFVQLARRATTIAYGQEPYLIPLIEKSYPLAPLRQVLDTPIILTGMGHSAFEKQSSNDHRQNFTRHTKFILLLFEAMRNRSI